MRRQLADSFLSRRSEPEPEPEDLANAFKIFRKKGELSDVTFLVGKGKQPLKAHRMILAARSDVFKSMLFGDLLEGPQVLIPNATPENFDIMLDYIYSGSASDSLSLENSLEVMILADQYDVAGLVTAAVSVIKYNINEQNIIDYLKISHDTYVELYQACLRAIDADVQMLIDNEEYYAVPLFVMIDIFNRESLAIAETEALRAVMHWIELREDTFEERKKLLKSFEDSIRWSLISPLELIQICKPIQLLSKNIYIGVLEQKVFNERSSYQRICTGTVLPKNFYGKRAAVLRPNRNMDFRAGPIYTRSRGTSGFFGSRFDNY